jgi:hypothetical protein
MDGPMLRKAVIRSLSESGKSKDSPYGNTLYRVTRAAQARRILADTWPGMDFSDESKLGLHFRRYSRATIALMSGDFQTGTETFPRERREDISTDPNFSLAVAGRVCQSRVLGKARWSRTRTSQDRTRRWRRRR